MTILNYSKSQRVGVSPIRACLIVTSLVTIFIGFASLRSWLESNARRAIVTRSFGFTQASLEAAVTNISSSGPIPRARANEWELSHLRGRKDIAYMVCYRHISLLNYEIYYDDTRTITLIYFN